MRAKTIIRNLLPFQYESLGYGKFRCRSCGALKYVDYGDKDQPTTEKVEEHSKNCPWHIARDYIESPDETTTN